MQGRDQQVVGGDQVGIIENFQLQAATLGKLFNRPAVLHALAIFLITTDPFIVYTSNIFAILGLRALYFALAAMVHRFHYLKYALSILLIFIGSKIFVAWGLGWEKFPPAWGLGITVAILASGVLFSLWKTRGDAAPAPGVGHRHGAGLTARRHPGPWP